MSKYTLGVRNEKENTLIPSIRYQITQNILKTFCLYDNFIFTRIKIGTILQNQKTC